MYNTGDTISIMNRSPHTVSIKDGFQYNGAKVIGSSSRFTLFRFADGHAM